MNANHQVCLGPFFTPRAPSRTNLDEVTPLSLAVEWATPEGACSIELFRHRPKRRPGVFNPYVQAILFRRRDLPFEVDCRAQSIVKTSEGDFLPLDALLVALHDQGKIATPILPMLREVDAIAPQFLALSDVPYNHRTLKPVAEAEGFRLMNVRVPEKPQAFITIGWKPNADAFPGHAVIAKLTYTSDGTVIELKDGFWEKSALSASELLRRALGDMMPNPIDIFTPAGVERIHHEIRCANGQRDRELSAKQTRSENII